MYMLYISVNSICKDLFFLKSVYNTCMYQQQIVIANW